MQDKFKKKISILLAVGVIFLSGLSGFGGTYLANMLNGSDAENTLYSQTILEDSNTYEPVNAVNLTKSNQSTEEDNYNTLNQSTEQSQNIDLVQSTNKNQNIALEQNGKQEQNPDLEYSNTFESVSISNLTSTDKNTKTELTIVEIAALTADSVVEITTETVTTDSRLGQYVSEGAGSGVVISSDGYIVTNNHVIEGASKITVRLKNGKEYSATLIGTDSKTDVAVIKISASKLQAAIYGDSDKLLVGELAVAIGNPLGKLGGTVTEGIISALNRDIEIDGESMNLLQTSAAINPGNSGGGLFNSYGELIGIVNAKSSGSDIEGLGFAIPINTVKNVTEQLIKYGYVPGRIDLGITMIDILDTRTALSYRVQSLGVYVYTAASDTELKSGDKIISVNGTTVNTSAEVKKIAEQCSVGDTIKLTIQRNGTQMQVNLKLQQKK